MKITTILLAAIFSLTLTSASNAAVIYDNGDPNTQTGYYVGNGGTSGPRDDFSISGGGTILSAGVYIKNTGSVDFLPQWNGDLSYTIYDSTRNNVLANGDGQAIIATDSGITWCCSGNAWLLEFNLESGFTAAAGQTYWLGINGVTGTRSNYWVTTGGGNGTKAYYDTSQLNYEFAFFLNNTLLDGSGGDGVPGPGALALLGFGLLGLGMRRRTT